MKRHAQATSLALLLVFGPPATSATQTPSEPADPETFVLLPGECWDGARPGAGAERYCADRGDGAPAAATPGLVRLQPGECAAAPSDAGLAWICAAAPVAHDAAAGPVTEPAPQPALGTCPGELAAALDLIDTTTTELTLQHGLLAECQVAGAELARKLAAAERQLAAERADVARWSERLFALGERLIAAERELKRLQATPTTDSVPPAIPPAIQ